MKKIALNKESVRKLTESEGANGFMENRRLSKFQPSSK